MFFPNVDNLGIFFLFIFSRFLLAFLKDIPRSFSSLVVPMNRNRLARIYTRFYLTFVYIYISFPTLSNGIHRLEREGAHAHNIHTHILFSLSSSPQ